MQTAKAMLETKRYLYVGFMCHQTIEKALKGIFVARNHDEELPYIHKLVRLANLCGVTEELSEAQLSLLDTLNPLNIEARYPDYKRAVAKSLNAEITSHFVEQTKQMQQWILQKCFLAMKPSGSSENTNA